MLPSYVQRIAAGIRFIHFQAKAVSSFLNHAPDFRFCGTTNTRAAGHGLMRVEAVLEGGICNVKLPFEQFPCRFPDQAAPDLVRFQPAFQPAAHDEAGQMMGLPKRQSGLTYERSARSVAVE